MDIDIAAEQSGPVMHIPQAVTHLKIFWKTGTVIDDV
jgi:hypothetical protein